MSTLLPTNRYSATVVLSLIAGDRIVRLAQVAPDFVILAEHAELPPCDAEIHVDVDGNVHHRQVFLVDGIDPSRERIRVQVSSGK